MFARQVIGSVLALGCCGAWADAETSIDIRAKAGQEQVTQDTGPVQNTLTYSYGGGTGTAYANLETGILRDYAVAPPFPGGSDFSYSAVQSRIADVITFAPTAGGTAYLYWSVDGTLPSFDGHLDSTATVGLFVSGGTNDIAEDHAFVNDSCAPYSVTTCEAGTRWAQSGVVAFQIDGNNPISIQAVLQTEPADGGVGDFSNTGRLYLVVPTGETFTSDSGVFLDEATPISSVPEPVSSALLLGGLALLFARNKRGAQAHERRSPNS